MSRLIVFRERLRLTQEELAEKSGISVRTIQRIEAGAEPKGYTLKTLAKALDIQESELLNEHKGSKEINYTLIKLINISSLPFTFIPPANILLPLLIMFAKKQFCPLAKQIVSLQILYTIASVVVFMLSAFMKNWFSLGNKFVLIVMILLVLINLIIILINTAAIDKNKQLCIRLDFSII